MQAALATALILCTLGVTATALLPIFLRKNYSLFELPTFFATSVIVGVLAKAAYVVSLQEHSQLVDHKLLLDGDLLPLFYGAAVCLVGLLCFAAGYLWHTRGAPLQTHKTLVAMQSWNQGRIVLIASVLIGISLCALVLFIVTNDISIGLGNISQKRFSAQSAVIDRLWHSSYYLYKVSTLAKLAFYVLLVFLLTSGAIRSRRLLGALLLTALSLGLFVPFFFGNRAGVLLIVLDAIVISYYLGLRISVAKSIPLILLGGALFLVASNLRVNNAEGSVLLDHLLGGRYFLDLTKTSHIVAAVPDRIDYLYGETLVGWMVSPVPVDIWPGKPMFLGSSKMLADVVFGEPFNAVPAGLVGELFMNFGWAGVALGMFLVGVLGRHLFRLYLKHGNSVLYSVMYSLLVTRMGIFLLNNDLGTAVLKSGIDVVPIIFLLWISQRRIMLPPRPAVGVAP